MASSAHILKESGATWSAAKQEEIVLRVHSYHDADGDYDALVSGGDSIASELRDNIAQQLTAISLHLGKLGRTRIGAKASHDDERYSIEEQVLRVIQDVQSLSRRGTSTPISARGFTDALRTLAQSVRTSVGLHTILMLYEASTLGDVAAEQLYRIAQEAVHNVIRHARATSLRVEFRMENQSFLLVVRDDGIGTPAEARSVGKGFKRMTSRARSIGAQLEVRSVPGRGTAVRCVVPF